MANILLVDDDISIRGFLAAALTHQGYSVDEAEDGAKAYGMIQSNPPYRLLLTDIVMPHMDGLELARKAKGLYPDLAVLFITGFSGMTTDADDAAQGSQVISKPFHLTDIVKEVGKIFTK